MSDNSKIEWTQATWNVVTGCGEVSPGCDRCYAKTFAERWRGTPGHYFEQGFDLVLRPDKLGLPLRWRKPRKVFVNSMSDLFHKDVPDDFIAKVFAMMAATPHHTYQVLTKRHARMRSLLNNPEWRSSVFARESVIDIRGPERDLPAWPLPNVHLGVSVENQHWADIRIPALLETPAAFRWLSCEPLLGRVSLIRWLNGGFGTVSPAELSWVVVGGESGAGARPMHPGWARNLRDECTAAGVPFFFKQWGEWAPNGWLGIGEPSSERERLVGDPVDDKGRREIVERLGKKTAGRLLDGRTWDEYPSEPAPVGGAR